MQLFNIFILFVSAVSGLNRFSSFKKYHKRGRVQAQGSKNQGNVPKKFLMSRLCGTKTCQKCAKIVNQGIFIKKLLACKIMIDLPGCCATDLRQRSFWRRISTKKASMLIKNANLKKPLSLNCLLHSLKIYKKK